MNSRKLRIPGCLYEFRHRILKKLPSYAICSSNKALNIFLGTNVLDKVEKEK